MGRVQQHQCSPPPSSLSYEVRVRSAVGVSDGDAILIVGGAPELGGWSVGRAVPTTRGGDGEAPFKAQFKLDGAQLSRRSTLEYKVRLGLGAL